MKDNSKGKICPISGKPKARRHVVAPQVWANCADKEKDQWKANAKPGTLRRYAIRAGRG